VSIEAAVIGLVVAALFVELTGLYPGGVIVPAYLAVFANQPLRLVGTLIVAVLAWLTYRLLCRVFILFGRRRFVVLIVIAASWALIGYRLLPLIWPEALELRAIGWVIAGLIANTFERQGLAATVLAMGIASAVTYFVVRLVLAF
jgi:poly-gamma-glutamate biosynthesis protein PgsC/CapC